MCIEASALSCVEKTTALCLSLSSQVEAYQQWVSDQRAMKLAMAGEASKEFSMTELVAKGEGVYNTACAVSPAKWRGDRGHSSNHREYDRHGRIDTHVDIIVNGKSRPCRHSENIGSRPLLPINVTRLVTRSAI